MVKNKKAISPVVATVLLLVVAVVAVIGFQNWFQTYQSGVTADVEKNSKTGTAVTIERLETGALYLKNSGTDPVNITSVTVKSLDSNCSSFNLASGVININGLNNCNINALSLNPGESVDVVVVTDKGIFQEKEIVR